jgi:RsiW-degrading membrane proteinase PrsW (M82 family)
MNSRKIVRAIRLKRRRLNLSASEVAAHISIKETDYLLFESLRKEISKEQYDLIFQLMQMTEDDFNIDQKLDKKLPETFFDLFRIHKKDCPKEVIIPKIKVKRHHRNSKDIHHRRNVDVESYRRRVELELFHPEDIEHTSPMLFTYVFIGMVIMTVLATIGQQYALSNLMMSAIVPICLLVFIHEIAIPKQVKGMDTIKYFFFGGMTSILLVYGLRSITSYPDWYFASDMLTGLVEELAKIIIVILIFQQFKVKHVMVGILIGFAVGAGFDVFETSDYGMYAFLDSGGDFLVMMGEIVGRSIYAIFGIGHHFWTAMIAGTLVLVNQTGKVGFKDLFKPIALMMFMFIAFIHGLWNFTATYFPIAQYGVLIVSTLLFVRFVYVQYVNTFIDIQIKVLAQQKLESEEQKGEERQPDESSSNTIENQEIPVIES